jgi:hypothetical protein
MIASVRFFVAAAMVLLSLQPLLGQTGKVDNGFELKEIKFGYEARHDRFRFNFHNPSSFNTTALVPHEFVQTYTADNHWGVVKASYLLLRIPWASELGMTPQRTNYGDDYDTFYQPSGDVVISGTTGNVSTRGIRFTQRGWLWQLKGFSLGAGYQYLRYQARFQFGNSFEIHTQPPSAILEKLPIQETTRSRMHDFDVAARRDWSLPHRGSFSAEVRYSPVVSAFLTTILPAKYPGEEINFFAASTGLSARLALRYLIRAASLEFFVDYSRSWSYSQSQFRRETLAFGVQVGWAPNP